MLLRRLESGHSGCIASIRQSTTDAILLLTRVCRKCAAWDGHRHHESPAVLVACNHIGQGGCSGNVLGCLSQNEGHRLSPREPTTITRQIVKSRTPNSKATRKLCLSDSVHSASRRHVARLLRNHEQAALMSLKGRHAGVRLDSLVTNYERRAFNCPEE